MPSTHIHQFLHSSLMKQSIRLSVYSAIQPSIFFQFNPYMISAHFYARRFPIYTLTPEVCPLGFHPCSTSDSFVCIAIAPITLSSHHIAPVMLAKRPLDVHPVLEGPGGLHLPYRALFMHVFAVPVAACQECGTILPHLTKGVAHQACN